MTIVGLDRNETADFAAHLREIAVGCRLSRTRWGIRKALDDEHKSQAASVFDAEEDCFSAAKKLIDTKNARYKAVSSIFSQATSYWKQHTLPFTEDGIRLLRREHVTEFEQRISQLQSELDGAVALLEQHYGELLSDARRKLGRLFNASDYPSSLAGLFRLTVDYPALEPDPSLVRVSATLYQRECDRVRNRFQEAVQLAEQSFIAEFRKLIEHIATRLQGLSDGTTKQFREENLTNLQAFFDRFKSLSIGSSADLEKLVDDAKQAVAGYRPDWLEDSQPLRDLVRGNLAEIQNALDQMMVARPKRKISWEE